MSKIYKLKPCLLLAGFTLIILSSAFKADELMHRLAQETQSKLTALHIPGAAAKIKKIEITLSDEGFLRYRKTFISGKQEYFSLNVSRLKSIDFIGNTNSGNLTIRTLEDDVIVQTYNDRGGNVDSMAMQLNVQLSAIEPEDVNAIQQNLFEMKEFIDKHSN